MAWKTNICRARLSIKMYMSVVEKSKTDLSFLVWFVFSSAGVLHLGDMLLLLKFSGSKLWTPSWIRRLSLSAHLKLQWWKERLIDVGKVLCVCEDQSLYVISIFWSSLGFFTVCFLFFRRGSENVPNQSGLDLLPLTSYNIQISRVEFNSGRDGAY